MPKPAKTKLRIITIIYWTLLFYVVAALIWWFISLERQNQSMASLKFETLLSKAINYSPGQLMQEQDAIRFETRRNTLKYVAEGITFLILILIGAWFVYRSVRRQFRLQQQQQNFMMAVTHELKTPISVTTLNLETLQKYHLDPEKQKKIIQTTLMETSRLNTLTNNILISSQIEGDGYPFTKDELDLSDLMKDCLQEYKTRYPERVFIEEIEPEVEIVGDPLLLQMMINNLLENAIKYSPKEKPITLMLQKNDQSVILSMKDEGEGIPDDEKKKVFDKFYRIGNEFTRKTQGTGLGLYLCRKIAADHNADITVTNNIPVGSIFTINFHL